MTAGTRRLAQGGRIDRSRRFNFTFNGRALKGHPGDTLASALLANGVRIVGRSFKYHRPRGVFGLGAEEPNALVQLGRGARTEPNLRATQVQLFDGLVAASQNCWPSVGFDIGALANWMKPLLPAGFYYKTFIGPGRPNRAWTVYEPFIRRAAGMGKAPSEPDPDRYERVHWHCDVLVVGAGPAGIAAALSAARTGARVVVADEQTEPGGHLIGCAAEIDGRPALDWVGSALSTLSAMPEVTVLRRATVEGAYDHMLFGIAERLTDAVPADGQPRQRYWQVRTRQVVLAAGAIERPIAFLDNDRPGVMLASAAAAYAVRYGVNPGERILIFTNNDWAYRSAIDLKRAGCTVERVIDLRRDPGPAARAAEAAGIPVRVGAAVVRALGRRLAAVDIAQLTPDGSRLSGATERIGCDCLAVSGGFTPTVHLFSQARGKLLYDREIAAFIPGAAPAGFHLAGGCRGSFSLSLCLSEGFAAGAAAAMAAGFGSGAVPPLPHVALEERSPPRFLWRVPAHRRGKRWIDLQNDVTDEDLALAVRENYANIEHAKRYTTLGMGTDQGKTSNPLGFHILAELLDRPSEAVGVTTFRPPYTPTTFGAFVGRNAILNHPVRRTPMHEWHEARGAPFLPNGLWLRAQCYPRSGESVHEAIAREALAVRQGVGMVDVSTLGKIDIQGRDAMEFLNRVYMNGFSTLAVGKGRYGLMLREDGFVFDDGVTMRLGERHFHMTTTTANAARVHEWLEKHLQTQWRDLEVYLTAVTDDWAGVAIAGPKARTLLASVTDADVSDAALPFMGMIEAEVARTPARIFRISFSGELSYEVNVPADQGLALWEALIQAGTPYGLVPYGLEALSVLRIEKGHIVGAEFDGRATPTDLGFERMIGRKKDFIGRWALGRAAFREPGRLQLVGLEAVNPKEPIPAGAQLVPTGDGATAQPSHGHVTSTCFSPNLGAEIALGMLADGRSRHDQQIVAVSPVESKVVRVRVRPPCFIDAEGTRLHV
ncbi:MAG TPA: sarcosine oxidase subunit alpha family protein [Alphaproteobacteria bacterium]|nr:sarcosine oxidase subunit alpha family protein [Alphaproteobacteria bacterium]